MDRSSGPETKVQRGSATKAHLHCFAHREAFSLPLAVYSPCTPVSFRKENSLRSTVVHWTAGMPRVFWQFSERKAGPVSEPFSRPAASNAKPLGGSMDRAEWGKALIGVGRNEGGDRAAIIGAPLF